MLPRSTGCGANGAISASSLQGRVVEPAAQGQLGGLIGLEGLQPADVEAIDVERGADRRRTHPYQAIVQLQLADGIAPARLGAAFCSLGRGQAGDVPLPGVGLLERHLQAGDTELLQAELAASQRRPAELQARAGCSGPAPGRW